MSYCRDSSPNCIPGLGTEKTLMRKYPNKSDYYIFTIKVDALGLDYHSFDAYMKSSGIKYFMGKSGVGHTWVKVTHWEKNKKHPRTFELKDIREGGHSGECTRYWEIKKFCPHPDLRVKYYPPFHSFNSGVVYLAHEVAQDPVSARVPSFIGREYKDNPAKWLWFIYRDGHWAKNSGGHDRVTHEASWLINWEEYQKVTRHIDDLKSHEGAALRNYGLIGNQCTKTAQIIAKQANIMLKDQLISAYINVPRKIDSKRILKKFGADPSKPLILWRDARWSYVVFAAPEKMGKAIINWAGNRPKVHAKLYNI